MPPTERTPTTETAKHSPLPWICWNEPANWHGLSARICTEKYEPIAQVQISGWPRKTGLANADFLCRAANCHDQLVAALEKAREDINWMLNNRQFLNPSVFDYLDAALAAAKEKP